MTKIVMATGGEVYANIVDVIVGFLGEKNSGVLIFTNILVQDVTTPTCLPVGADVETNDGAIGIVSKTKSSPQIAPRQGR
jgi:hypothetical protein